MNKAEKQLDQITVQEGDMSLLCKVTKVENPK